MTLRAKMEEYKRLKVAANKLLDDILNELHDKIGEEAIEKMRGIREHKCSFNYCYPLTEFEDQFGDVDTDLVIEDIKKAKKDS